MEWAFLFLILVILVIILSISLISLKIQIYRVTGQLHTVLSDSKKEIVTISLGDRGLEHLVELINKIVAKENKNFIEIKHREDKLKENISCLSHDLRTPLTSIRGYLKLLETAPEEKRDKYMEALFGKALKLERLIDDFYQISLLEDGRYSFEYEDVDISELLTEILLENYPLFEEKGITPVIDLPKQSVLIRVDKKACVRIIQNLLFNALNETAGNVSVQLHVLEGMSELIISNSVRNKMIDVNKIFERFYVNDKSRCNGNTGQGLYIVKELLEKMGCRPAMVQLENNRFSISIIFEKADGVL